MKKSLWPALLSSSLVAVGCASIAVTGEAIVDRTAFALGLAKAKEGETPRNPLLSR